MMVPRVRFFLFIFEFFENFVKEVQLCIKKKKREVGAFGGTVGALG